MEQAEILERLDTALKRMARDGSAESVKTAMRMLYALRADLSAEQRAGG
jgi:hypothetical protein